MKMLKELREVTFRCAPNFSIEYQTSLWLLALQYTTEHFRSEISLSSPEFFHSLMANDLSKLADQSSAIYRLIRGMHGTYLIDTGVRLGFFEKILDSGESGVTSFSLSSSCGTNPRYTEIWCQMASSLELLSASDNTNSVRSASTRYTFAPCMDELLGRKDGAFYIGGAAHSHIQISRDYNRISNLFKTGKTFPFQQHNKKFLLSVAKSGRNIPRRLFSIVFPKMPELKERLESKGGRILDIGCGAGYAVVEMAKIFPKCTCSGIDIEPNSIKLAKKLILKNKLQARVKVTACKDQNYGPAESCDLITMILVLHEISPNLKQAVLNSAARALVPGGTLLIYDEAYPQTFSDLTKEPKYFAVMAQWFESLWGNVINTKIEIRELIAKSGLTIQDETDFSRFYIVSAAKK